ncbi:MAG: hypothetical protein ABI678_28380, partial [Kofleriaceae bacterium]
GEKDPTTIVEWSTIAPAQQERLVRIAALVHAVDRTANQISTDRRAAVVVRERTVLAKLASAAATSHLAQTSDAAFAEAFAEHRKGALAAFDGIATTLDETMGAARERLDQEGANGPKQVNGDPVRDVQSREQWVPYTELRTQAADLERRVAAGASIDPLELQRIEVAMRVTNMEQRLHAMQLTLDGLSTAQILAAEGLVSHVVSTSSFRSLRGAIAFLHTQIGSIYNDLESDRREVPSGMVSTPGDDITVRATAVGNAEQRFTALTTEYALGDFLQHAAEVIEDQQTRTMVVKLVAQITASIAIGLATGGAGGAAILGEGFGGGVATVAVEAFGNGTVQYLMSAGERGAESYGSALVENLFYAGANRYVVGPALAKAGAALGATGEAFERQLALLQVQETRAELAIRKAGQFAEWTAKESVAVTAHAITGMALGATYAHARAAVGGVEANAQTVEDFELQALSVSVARHVHVAVRAHIARYRAQSQLSPDGKALADAALALEASIGKDLERTTDTRALKALEDLLKLKEQDLALLDKLDPASPHGPSAEQRAAMRTDLQAQRAELRGRDMLDLRWRLLGMRQLTREIWSGTAVELDHGLAQARALGMEVVIVEQSVEITRVRIDGEQVALHVVDVTPRVSSSRAAAEHPAETAWGHVWPGEVPSIAPAEIRALFEQAHQIYTSFRADRFQGGSAGRVHWTRFLVSHGIQVDGVVRAGGEHEIHEVARPVEP